MERLTLDDTIKALRCVASQDTGGGCYADHENFIHMDDEYKRIVCGTGEDLRDPISDKEAVGYPYYQDTYECCFENGGLYWLKDVAELLEELKSYKDLEEQGLLVKLPDDLFKKVYRITYEYTECSKFGETVIDCENYNCNCDCDSEKKFYIVENNLQFMLFCNYYNELDKTVFLTREEAEKKLEEIQNDKT